MIKTRLIVMMFIVVSTSAYGADNKPSEKSIKELLRVTESQKMVDGMYGQMDNYMKTFMQQAIKDQPLTQEQQKQLGDMQARMIAIFRQEMNWENLEPLVTKIYRDSFTQQDVDGMLAFYTSSSGQAVIKKMPLVMQNTMNEMQKLMGPITQKILKMEEEFISEMKADASKK